MRAESRFNLIVAPIVAAGALWLAPCAVAAPAPPMTVAVHPTSGAASSYFDLPAKRGTLRAAGTLEVRNRLPRPVTVVLDPVNALTASTLGSAYRLRRTAMRGPTRWTRLSARRLSLAPNARATVTVSVLPAIGARPGDYLSGISVQALQRNRVARVRRNLAIASVQRYAVGLLVRIPGPRHPLIRLTRARIDSEPAGVTFFIYGRNAGNVILQNVHGRELITRGKRTVASSPMGPGTFVTGTSIQYPLIVPREHPREGAVYRVRAYLRYRGGIARLDTLVRFSHRSAARQAALGGAAASRSARGLLPLILSAAAGVALFACAFLVWMRIRSRRKSLLDTLEHSLEHARATGEPLSLIRIARNATPSRSLEHALHARMRRSDRLYSLDRSAVVVIAPDTPPESAELIAEDLRRHLDRDPLRSGDAHLTVVAPNGDTTAADLLAELTANGASAGMVPPG